MKFVQHIEYKNYNCFVNDHNLYFDCNILNRLVAITGKGNTFALSDHIRSYNALNGYENIILPYMVRNLITFRGMKCINDACAHC